MKYHWTPQDRQRIKEIFEGNPGPEAYENLRRFIEIKKFPLRKGSGRLASVQKIALVLDAAKQLARRHGWIKPFHNAKVHTLGWTESKQKLFKLLYEEEGYSWEKFAEHEDFKADFAKCRSKEAALHNFAGQLGCDTKKRKETVFKRKPKKEEKPPVLVRRRWPDPEIIKISKEQWEKPGTRTAYLSLGQYLKDGWRCGLFDLAGAIAAQEGIHVPAFAGGIVSKEWVQAEIKRLSKGVSRKFLPDIIEHIKREAVEALSSVLPRFKKPDEAFIRWYIMASLPFDGPHGEAIIRMLQEQRLEDVRQYKTGGERIEVRQPDGKPSIYHGVVLPKHGRLHSKYMSAKVERDLEDVEEQTSRGYPNLWVHGTSATALYKPAGERTVPYISLPGFQKLEAEDKKIAENQIGLTIVEDMPDGDRLVHVWSFRDIIAREREFITGIKERASELHKKIVDIIKREGARHPGRLADELGVTQEKLDEEIKFLVEPKRSSRLTWPGLHYDEASQRYDFHLDWIQELLRYQAPKDKDGWEEDSFLFCGCLHFGYTTTDYEFIVKKFPEYILKYGIENLEIVGDVMAGLHHSFMHKGEVLHMNNTEQEEFGGEGIATIVYKVFIPRFNALLNAEVEKKPDDKEVLSLVKKALMRVHIKKGNHDRWQEYDGNTALVKFYDTLIYLLSRHIRSYLAEKGFTSADPSEIIQEKILVLKEYDPTYVLPSGIKVGLIHPHMARADTTSLRAEKALKHFQRIGCQVVGIANFHVATFVHKWWPKTGQSVAAQTGTEVILTDFEYNKLKDLDFGPLYLRVRSYKGRIFKTTLAAFNQPMLKEPIPKWTDITELKQRLGLLGYT